MLYILHFPNIALYSNLLIFADFVWIKSLDVSLIPQ